MKILNYNKNFDKTLDNLISQRNKKVRSSFISVKNIINDLINYINLLEL